MKWIVLESGQEIAAFDSEAEAMKLLIELEEQYPTTYFSITKKETKEAEKLMEHPSVRKAYEHFMLTCQLVKKNDAT